MTTEWRPMDTAPRDGTRVLLWRWGEPIIGSWDRWSDPQCWVDDVDDIIWTGLDATQPEAWAPITPYVPAP